MNNIQQLRGNARWRGFSLIELMVVLAVFAILSTIAVGSYRRYALRATRTEARLSLLAIQVAQEKFFLQNNQYAQDIATAGQPDLGENLSFNMWRVTPDHAPAGSIAEVRRAVYATAASLRRRTNGVPETEPREI